MGRAPAKSPLAVRARPSPAARRLLRRLPWPGSRPIWCPASPALERAPLLADQGLVAALESRGRKSPVPVAIDPDGARRYPQQVEAAVYFCCLEAMQNVAKYAQAATIHIHLADEKGWLTFSVADDGHGYDPTTTATGSGIQNMTDRLSALGGSLNVRSAPGVGTTVTGRIPVAAG
jgi:signal transduction histidine kinase